MQPYPPPPSRPNPAPWIALAAVGVVAAGLLGFAVGRSGASGPVTTRTVTAAATETEERRAVPTTAASRSTGIGPGTHVVGRDIQSGEYRTEGPDRGSTCYWARLADTSGDRGTIIANDTPNGPSTVTIKGDDGAFKTSGCQEWVRVG